MTPPTARAVDDIEAAVAEVARLNTRGLDEPSRQAQSSAEAISNHANAIVDRPTQEALDSLRALRRQIDDAERMVLDNAARIQSEIRSHINMASLTLSAADVIGQQLADHRAKHAEIVGAVTTKGGITK